MSIRHPNSPEPSHFDLTIDVEARTISPAGEVDIVTAPLLTAAALMFISEMPGDLTFDLGAVSFADSTLIGVLRDVREDGVQAPAELFVVNESAAVKRLFLAGGVARRVVKLAGREDRTSTVGRTWVLARGRERRSETHVSGVNSLQDPPHFPMHLN